ncbi:MAG: 30S ribosomal protein S20 [Weeksellaceae bacterium]
MPNIKSAKKKMKQDVKRTQQNGMYKSRVEDIMKDARKGKMENKATFLSEAYSKIDKAAKKMVIHANRAKRLKSRVSRLVAGRS